MDLPTLMVHIQCSHLIEKSGCFDRLVQSQVAKSHHIVAMDAVTLVQIVFPDSQIGQ